MCQRRRCLRYGLVSLISVLLGKIIIQLYPLFSLANIFQVNINPAAFDSPDKHSQSEDEDSIPPETPCSDLPPQTSTECFANVTFINQNSYPPMKPNSAPLPINTCRSPPLTISFQDSTLNVTSSTNAMGMLPITSPIAATPAVSHAINLHLQSPIAISAASSSEPITPTSSPMVSTTLNSAVKLRMVGEGNSPYESPFTTPLKNGLTSPFANDLLNSHQRFHKNDQSHFQCKSCRGVFKPHQRHTHPYLSLPASPENHRQSLSSTQDAPERPQVFSLFPTSHIQSADPFCTNNSPPSYYASTTSHVPNNSTPDLLERKFHCPICEKSYKSNTGLKRHLIVHSGERPFQCHFCFKSFFRKYVLTTHISRVHNKVLTTAQS